VAQTVLASTSHCRALGEASCPVSNPVPIRERAGCHYTSFKPCGFLGYHLSPAPPQLQAGHQAWDRWSGRRLLACAIEQPHCCLSWGQAVSAPGPPHSLPGAWAASVPGAPASPQPRKVPGRGSSFSRNAAPMLSRAPASQPRPQGTGVSSRSGKKIR